jgi:hypothetical protein
VSAFAENPFFALQRQGVALRLFGLIHASVLGGMFKVLPDFSL